MDKSLIMGVANQVLTQFLEKNTVLITATALTSVLFIGGIMSRVAFNSSMFDALLAGGLGLAVCLSLIFYKAFMTAKQIIEAFSTAKDLVNSLEQPAEEEPVEEAKTE